MIAIPPEDIPIALAVLEAKGEEWDPHAELFGKQRAFVDDRARFKAALVGRRGGKTTGCILDFIETAQKGGRCCFIALTLDHARSLFWKPFKEMLEQHKFPCRTNETLLEVTFPSGGEIKLRGADKPKELAKMRGVPHDKVAIDEAAFFGLYVEELVEDVIEPSLMDRLGTLYLLSTPNASLLGLFYEITRPEIELRRKGWSVHEWDIEDNPNIKHAAAELEAIKARHNWTETTPKFLREYRRRWVRSNEDLVYAYDERINSFDDLPPGRPWSYVLAVDVGFRDRTAFVIGCYESNAPDFYVTHAEAESGLIPSKIAERIQKLRETYRPGRILMDCGALGLSIAEEFRQRFNLPIEAAEKKEKASMIELINGDLKLGHVKARRDSPLVAEWQTLQYDEHGEEDPRCKNDLCDAALYAYRAARHYLYRPPPPKQPDEDRFQQMVERSIRSKYEENEFAGWED